MAQRRLAEGYDHAAAGYESAVIHNRRAAERLVALLPDRPYESVLDVGCGTGFATVAMLDRFPSVRSVVGIDVSGGMLEELARKLDGRDVRARLIEADVAELASEDLSVDAVLCNMAYHWFADRPAVLAAIAASLRPGGVFGLVAPGVGHDAEFVEVLRSMEPPAHRALSDAFGENSIDPRDLRRDLVAVGLDPLDVWAETRLRAADPARYLARMEAVGSHILGAVMQAPEAEAEGERVEGALRAVVGDGLFEYTFVKTMALAAAPGGD